MITSSVFITHLVIDFIITIYIITIYIIIKYSILGRKNGLDTKHMFTISKGRGGGQGVQGNLL